MTDCGGSSSSDRGRNIVKAGFEVIIFGLVSILVTARHPPLWPTVSSG